MPTPSEPQHASMILEIICDEMRRSGAITFHRFIELCLYHPPYGYYNAERTRLGKAGDFYTSAHTAPVFARLVAQHLRGSWTRSGSPPHFELIELGPGDGSLAAELLSFIQSRFPDFLETLRYTGLEQSQALRQRIAENLRGFSGRARVVPDWETLGRSTPGEGECGLCVFANEFFDALPFHLLVWRNGWKERYVRFEGWKLVWHEDEPSSPDLTEQAESRFDPTQPRSEREDGTVAEIRPQAAIWMQRICELLRHQCGELLIIDYGYTLEELRRGRFPQGSALAYHRHQALDDLLANPGEQDITAHVNFSELIAIAEQCGLRLANFESQAKFLMDIGEQDQFGGIFSDGASEAERLRRARLLKTLILPESMGEAFRVLRMAARDNAT